jgi:hypothetical protein
VTESKSKADLPHEAIRGQIAHILESSIFIHSHRLGRFLSFTVETTLAGQADILKEYLIGTEVYDRKPPYHPSTDSIVRSEARRLRNKLKQYYESVGKDDSVFIYYRPGGYTPVFRMQRKDPNRIDTSRSLGSFLVEGLVDQGLNLGDGIRELEVQIVFEGTVRILHPGLEHTATEDSRNQKKRIQASLAGNNNNIHRT